MVKYVKVLGSAPARLLRRARLAALGTQLGIPRGGRPTLGAQPLCLSGARRVLEPAASTGRPCHRPLTMHSGAASKKVQAGAALAEDVRWARVLKGSRERRYTCAHATGGVFHFVLPLARGGRSRGACDRWHAAPLRPALYLLCRVRRGGGKEGVRVRCGWINFHHYGYI